MIFLTYIDAEKNVVCLPVSVGKLAKTLSTLSYCKMWLDVQSPNSIETEELIETFHINKEYLEFEDMKNNIEAYDSYTYFKIDSCISNGYDFEDKGILYSIQIRFFVFDDVLVTYCSQSHDFGVEVLESLNRIKPLDDFIYRCLFFIAECAFLSFDKEIEKIKVKIAKMEDRLGDNYAEGIVPILKKIKRKWALLDNLVEYQKYAFRSSRLNGMAFQEPAIMNALNNVYDNMEAVSKSLQNIKDNIRDVSSLHSHLMQSNANERILILTMVASVFIPLTFLVSFFWMNISLIGKLTIAFVSIIYMLGGFIFYKRIQGIMDESDNK